MAKKFTFELTAEEINILIDGLLTLENDKIYQVNYLFKDKEVQDLISNINNQYFKQWNYKAQKGTK